MTFEQVQTRLNELKTGRPSVYFHPEPLEYEVVWQGGELLPDRESVGDDRLRYVPSYDLDDGEAVRPEPTKRIYNRRKNA